jgi:hypothetical protein
MITRENASGFSLNGSGDWYLRDEMIRAKVCLTNNVARKNQLFDDAQPRQPHAVLLLILRATFFWLLAQTSAATKLYETLAGLVPK